ncbi:hypothetical protein F5144DRAFT_598964 [Chaetomium tenue]|uniref:Uncharacterized protein n=1 Tax=Chaetomium tenue TaxID=1854479 RepID=A0ACB7PGT0_9PEZI|nr:hypothetical protein F5144DRAFT_598964 [Chaetomium globosum]
MTFDMLLCTASADDGFDLSAYLSLLRVHGRFEMLEMLKLAAEKGIRSWVETIPVGEKGVGEALERLHKNDVRYRFTLVDYDKQFQ